MANDSQSGARNVFALNDVTSATSPFGVMGGAPSFSLFVTSAGRVGIGTETAAAPLHVRRNDGSARLRVEEASATAEPRVMAELVNRGPALIRFANSEAGASSWRAGTAGTSDFAIGPESGSAALTLTPSGDATASGALQQSASGSSRKNAAPVDAQATLDKVAALPIAAYENAGDGSGARHIGPTGAQFRSRFDLGASDDAIAPGDLGGVSLVAIKTLVERLEDFEKAGGPQGPEGASGPDGAPGPAGAAGPPGPAGRDGAAAAAIKALKARNRKQDRRLKTLERKVRRMTRGR